MSSFPSCKVCHQEFSLKGPAPFLLPCLHAACETCVTSAAGGVISCSTCQRDVNLTETPLEKDVVTEKEILHLTVQQHPELILCTYEDDGNQAVCWCKECEDFLCENCQMTHSRLKITRKHIVEDFGDLRPESFDVDTYCTTHPKFILDIWDKKCCIRICRKCRDEGHAGHKTVEFAQAVEDIRREVSEMSNKVQSSVAQQGSNLTTIDADLQASDETSDNLNENISHTFNSLKTLINQREKELQIELQQHQEKIRRELNEKKNTSEACQKKCQTTSDYINKALQYSSRHDIMSLRHILQSKTRECISSAQAIVHESPPLPRFNTDGLEKLKSVLAGFGRIAWMDERAAEKQINDAGTQTEGLVSTECEDLKKELLQVKRSYEKQIHTLAKIKEEEKKGLYRLKTDISDAGFLLNCTRVDFSLIRYNAHYVNIISQTDLVNGANPNPSHIEWQLKLYKGTSSNEPLPASDSPLYFEVKAKLGNYMKINHLLEIGLARDENKDQHQWLAECPKSYSLTVSRCSIHKSICRQVWRHGEHLLCLPYPLENTPGTSDTLHIGVVYDSVRRCIAFFDVKNEKNIGKINNVDSPVVLWPMFGIDNHGPGSVSMSLVVEHGIHLTERKKALLLRSLL